MDDQISHLIRIVCRADVHGFTNISGYDSLFGWSCSCGKVTQAWYEGRDFAVKSGKRHVEQASYHEQIVKYNV